MTGNTEKDVGVFLIERRRLVREITVAALNHAEGLFVSGSSGGEDMEATLPAAKPDVILAGFYPGTENVMRGIAAYRKDNPCAAIILTDQSEWRGASDLVGRDACFVSKQTGVHGLADTVRRLAAGVAPESLGWRRDQPTRELPRLSPRELEILRRAAMGQSNREIAEAVHSSLKTVDTHMHNILDKLNLQSRTQAVLFAVQHKLLHLEDLTSAR